jgi:LPXTG-motif cell wall-anchored protein
MHKETWPFLFLLGVLFFNWPFIDLFKPNLPYYIFTAWGLFILVVGLLITFSKKKKKDQDV